MDEHSRNRMFHPDTRAARTLVMVQMAPGAVRKTFQRLGAGLGWLMTHDPAPGQSRASQVIRVLMTLVMFGLAVPPAWSSLSAIVSGGDPLLAWVLVWAVLLPWLVWHVLGGLDSKGRSRAVVVALSVLWLVEWIDNQLDRVVAWWRRMG